MRSLRSPSGSGGAALALPVHTLALRGGRPSPVAALLNAAWNRCMEAGGVDVLSVHHAPAQLVGEPWEPTDTGVWIAAVSRVAQLEQHGKTNTSKVEYTDLSASTGNL